MLPIVTLCSTTEENEEWTERPDFWDSTKSSAAHAAYKEFYPHAADWNEDEEGGKLRFAEYKDKLQALLVIAHGKIWGKRMKPLHDEVLSNIGNNFLKNLAVEIEKMEYPMYCTPLMSHENELWAGVDLAISEVRFFAQKDGSPKVDFPSQMSAWLEPMISLAGLKSHVQPPFRLPDASQILMDVVRGKHGARGLKRVCGLLPPPFSFP